jgi:excisionase family DNA binding protein
MKHQKREKTEPLPEKVLLRVEEVAQYFDVDRRTVYLWIENGHLETEDTPSGFMRITKESVDRCRFNKRNKN